MLLIFVSLKLNFNVPLQAQQAHDAELLTGLNVSA